MSAKNFSHVRDAIYSTPWAIKGEWLNTIAEIFEAHVAGKAPAEFTPRVKRGRHCPECKDGVMKAVMVQGERGKAPSGDMMCPECGCNCSEDNLPPYDLINGTAILPLSGPLFPKANLFTLYSGATSYDQFGADFSHAFNNGDVKSIIIESDSPGGSCLRLAELCSLIFAAREAGTKPIIGMIDPMAASAAYAIISQCDEVYITESGMAGSIGTVMRMNNWERAERNEGNDPVTLASSDIKAFGTPQSLAQYQSLIDMLLVYFEQFKEIVSRGRVGVDVNKIAGANVWVGKQSVSMGLADGVATIEKVLAQLSSK